MKKVLVLILVVLMMFSSTALAYNVSEPGVIPVVDEVVEYTIVAPDTTYIGDLNENTLTAWIAEKTNVQLVFQEIPDTEWDTKVNLLIASDELPDAFIYGGFTAAELADYGSQGVFMAMNDIIEEHGYYTKQVFEQQDKLPGAYTALDGKMYTLPDINECYHCFYSMRAWINQTWLDNLGLEYPNTLEELCEVLRAFKEQDANGNGDATDEIPFLYAAGYEAVERPLLSAYGIHTSESVYILQADADGKVYLANTTDAYKEYLKWMASAFADGLIEPEAYVIEANTITERASADRYGFYGCGSAPYVVAQQSIDYDKNFIGIAGLTSEYNETPTAGKASVVSTAIRVAINDISPYKEALVRMMDYMYTDEGELAGTFGKDGQTFDWQHNDILDVDVPKMRVFDDCASGEETRYKYATLNGTLALIEWNNDRRALFTAPIEDVQSDEILNEYGWAALVALAVREDGIQQVDCFPKLSYTAEEANERATLRADLENYLKQAKAQFMTGEIDVEEGWDNFVNTVNGMGLERLIEIEQAAYDRYMAVAQGDAESAA